jgi:hypothetical protein
MDRDWMYAAHGPEKSVVDCGSTAQGPNVPSGRTLTKAVVDHGEEGAFAFPGVEVIGGRLCPWSTASVATAVGREREGCRSRETGASRSVDRITTTPTESTVAGSNLPISTRKLVIWALMLKSVVAI